MTTDAKRSDEDSPDPSDEEQRDFILRDAADRLSLLGSYPTMDELSQMLMDRLVGVLGERIQRCAKLGAVVEKLAAELDNEPAGGGAFGQGMLALIPRNRGQSKSEAKALADAISHRFVQMVYDLAEVER